MRQVLLEVTTEYLVPPKSDDPVGVTFTERQTGWRLLSIFFRPEGKHLRLLGACEAKVSLPAYLPGPHIPINMLIILMCNSGVVAIHTLRPTLFTDQQPMLATIPIN